MRTALTIAGSDSGAGAGIQADLKTFAAHGVYGTSVITAVTAQNTVGVTMFEALSPELVRAQLDAVMSDIGAHAAKTGMLATAAIVETVAAAVVDLRIPKLVVDPVMVAKSGDRLLDDAAIRAMKSALLPRAVVVTPNIPEAEALTGLRITTDEDRREARGAFCARPGGRRDQGRPLRHAEHRSTAVLLARIRRVPARARPRPSYARHRCTFAASIAASLALGRTLAEAIPLAQRYIAGAIRNGPELGKGHGPMNHFWETSG